MIKLTDALLSTPAASAIFSTEGHVRHMLAFEAALARAEARAGVIPGGAADAIAAACRSEDFDLPALCRDALPAGTLAIPLVRRLTQLVGDGSAGFVHWGATSQDAIDTASILQAREGLDLVEAGLLAIAARCAELADRHRRTTMSGRTLLQQALPITFGLKAARWLALATRQTGKLRALRERELVVQFGGAAGTLAALGDHGVHVAELLGEELGLGVPPLPWHAERDRLAELACALGVVAGSVAKIATDVVLLAQTEVGEAFEGAVPGKGGSTTLPQKRNPVDAVEAIAAARLAIGLVPVVLGAMVQEHERAAGCWQAEWAAIPDLFCRTISAVERTGASLAGLEVDPARMRANLELGGGTIMAESLSFALARRVGKEQAQHVVEDVVGRTTRGAFRDAALNDERVTAVLGREEVERALDPDAYLGSADAFIDRALAGYRDLNGQTKPARRGRAAR